MHKVLSIPSFRAFAARGLDLLLPPRCLGCGSVTDAPGRLCLDCWSRLDLVAPPLCQACGHRFDLEPDTLANAGEAATLCGACHRRPPPYQRARAALIYDDGCRQMILRFKHADRSDAAPAFAGWMARAGGDLLAEAEILAPVPLHPARLIERRFNQAALICAALVKGTAGRPSAPGLTYLPDLLERRRRTASQGRLSPAQRRRNLTGAFAVNPRRALLIEGRRVLLVDDVLTTGATVEACSRVLLAAGARAVDVLVLARVARPRPV